MATVGIDLGTTNSLVAVLAGDQPRIIPNELGELMTPSAVAAATDGGLLVGRAARDRLVTDPAAGVLAFKRDMGTPARYRFGEREWTPVACSAAILGELKRVAEADLGEPVERAVIAVPAYFHDAPRQATIQAARLAGLEVDRLINEPTAAALAYGCQHRDAESTVLVFDLGGGTFDVTILELFEGMIDVKASGGVGRLGGEDYLEALFRDLAGRIGLDPVGRAAARLKTRLEVLKRRLSSEASAGLEWAGESLTITREEFAAVTAGLTDQLKPVIVRCLRDAGVNFRDLDGVILVGGASRMHVVHELMRSLSPARIHEGIDPDLVVAEGAAIQAALSERHEAVRDLVLTDVAPHSLGVEVGKQLPGGRVEGGFFRPLIDRNTTLPVSRSDRFSTFHPEQDEVLLQIYQGEHRMVADNHRLGTLALRGLRARPGQEHSGSCEVRFTYDTSGILEVEATVLSTDKRYSVVIEERPGELSPRQVAEVLERLRPLKIHPRDQLPNRARSERACRLFADLRGAEREHLAGLMDAFEAALAAQDPEAIAVHGALLDQFLQHFYQDERERLAPGGSDGDQPA